MKICISGATGFIGHRLFLHFTRRGDFVAPITRKMLRAEGSKSLQRLIDKCDVVINLAGESINQRWSPSAKLRIIESRTRTTRTIVTAINRSMSPKLLISASGVNLYPTSGCHNDFSRQRNRSFLADVVMAWEAEAKRLDPEHSLAIIRLGVVFASRGGAFEKITALNKLRIMPRIGSPTKHISWIDIADLERAIDFIISREDMRGVVNLCAPELTTQGLLVKASRSLITIPIPDALLRLIKGESAEIMINSCCAIPIRLVDAGFEYLSPTIEDLFENIKTRR